MIDRPDTPHADVLLEGIWEDEVTPDDLASRALSAAQASSYAFRVASEGTTATAQLGEVDVSEFLETETGKWAQGFIGIVRVGESLVHVSHALGELARSLQQVNLEQSEIVYQVEAEIEAAERQSAQTGTDPANRVAELIATARARAVEVAEKMVTPETASSKEKPSAGLVSGFMAFGRVPGTSAEAGERNGRVARNGHARNGYGIRRTRGDRNSREPGNGRAATGHAGSNGYESVNGQGDAGSNEAMGGHAETKGLETMQDSATINGHAIAETESGGTEAAAAAARDAFANSVDEAPMDLGFMGFGRMPGNSVPRAGDSAADDRADDVPARAEETSIDTDDAEAEVICEVESSEAPNDATEDDDPILAKGFYDLGRAPSVSPPVDVTAVPLVPQPVFDGFAFGRTPGVGGAGERDAVSGPIPVVAPAGFVPIPIEDVPVGDEQTVGESDGGIAIAVSDEAGGVDHGEPVRGSEPGDAVLDGGLSFGRVPAGARSSSGAVPTVPAEPVAVGISLDQRTDDAEPVGPGPDRDLDDEDVDVEGDDLVETAEDLVADLFDEDDDIDEDDSVHIDDEDLSFDVGSVEDESDAAADDFGVESVLDEGAESSDDAETTEPTVESDSPVALVDSAEIDEHTSIEQDAGDEPVAEEIAQAALDETASEIETETVGAERESESSATKSATAASIPVKKSGVIKFSDLINGEHAATAGVAGPTARTRSISARTAPVLATGPVILGRTEPLVLGKKESPEVRQVHDAAASILGSLSGGPHRPESGLHWAAGLIVKEEETVMAVTTSDAGWLPPGVVIPAGVRVLWNAPHGHRWASVDDPVRQLVDYAERNGFTLTAVATTHASRAYSSVVGDENLVRVHRPGAVLPGGRSRFEAVVSPARLQQIRALPPEQAQRQVRALIRDLETQPIAPEHAIGIEAARIDARCYLDDGSAVPPAVLEQLHIDERALADVLGLDRTPSSPADLTAPAPEAARLRDRLMERAIVVATLAAAYRDIESAVYAWTFARFLSSQDQDSAESQ